MPNNVAPKTDADRRCLDAFRAAVENLDLALDGVADGYCALWDADGAYQSAVDAAFRTWSSGGGALMSNFDMALAAASVPYAQRLEAKVNALRSYAAIAVANDAALRLTLDEIAGECPASYDAAFDAARRAALNALAREWSEGEADVFQIAKQEAIHAADAAAADSGAMAKKGESE